MDSNLILDILGNDTRRKILAVLSQEPMYFNQLAKEIGVGQQAILRHLQALEEGGLIETYAEKSDLGGPDRKYYRLNTSFILTISLTEDDFTISNQKIVELQHKESRKYYMNLNSIPKDMGIALSLLQKNLAGIEQEISKLESRLNDLRALKQVILHKLHKIGMDSFENDERKVLYKIVVDPPHSVAELSDLIDEKESSLRDIIIA
ncbi:MAG: helix-turn-helix domain-containing protein [Thermoproteota archaeon]|nr:helix-turn-helix domain-containing protein [Thermoproteota archaeon]MDQ3807007.1 helix-turn-helix domain-containing protein [Thermoproteota archaeon]